MNARSLFLASLIVCVLGGTGYAGAQSASGTNLKKAQQELDAAAAERDRLQREAQRLDRELQKIRRETVAAARAMQTRETEIGRIEARLKELTVVEQDKQAVLRANEGGLRQAIGALVRMSRNPPGAMLFQDMPPADTVRGAILLRATVPAIEGRVLQVRHDLEELVRARAEMAQRRTDLARALDNLTQDRVRLDALMVQKSTLRSTTEKDRRAAEARVRKLAQEARSLKDLVGRLAAEPKMPAPSAPVAKVAPSSPTASPSVPKVDTPPLRRFSEARGLVPYPVAGRIIGSYGEKLESGLARKGLSLETRFGAQVIAPFEGSVVFAGPFRGYGHLLIIEHGEGYHTLLAGLARIDVELGQAVLAGEPVGVMASVDAHANGQRPLLYVELRRNSQPIDPKPWMQARKENASG